MLANTKKTKLTKQISEETETVIELSSRVSNSTRSTRPKSTSYSRRTRQRFPRVTTPQPYVVHNSKGVDCLPFYSEHSNIFLNEDGDTVRYSIYDFLEMMKERYPDLVVATITDNVLVFSSNRSFNKHQRRAKSTCEVDPRKIIPHVKGLFNFEKSKKGTKVFVSLKSGGKISLTDSKPKTVGWLLDKCNMKDREGNKIFVSSVERYTILGNVRFTTLTEEMPVSVITSFRTNGMKYAKDFIQKFFPEDFPKIEENPSKIGKLVFCYLAKDKKTIGITINKPGRISFEKLTEMQEWFTEFKARLSCSGEGAAAATGADDTVVTEATEVSNTVVTEATEASKVAVTEATEASKAAVTEATEASKAAAATAEAAANSVLKE